jgi:hypothetical protein
MMCCLCRSRVEGRPMNQITRLLKDRAAEPVLAESFQYLLTLPAPRQRRFPQDQNDRLRLPTEIWFS